MPSKTPSISHFFLFIAGMISIHSANAAAPRNLAECEQAYFTAVSVPVAQRQSATVQSQLKSWCTSQCVTEKINIYAVQENKPVTEALRTQLTPGYQQTCTALFASTTSSTVATTPTPGTGAGANLPECTWNLAPGAQPSPDQQNICQQAIQRKQADDQRKAAAAAEQQRLLEQQQAAQKAQQRGTNTMLGAALGPQVINSIAQGLGGGGSGSNSGSGNNNGGAAPSGNGSQSYANPYGTPATAGNGSPQAAPPQPMPTPTTVQGATTQATEARTEAGQQVQNLPEQLQGPGQAANTGFDREQAAAPPRTEITNGADSASQAINGEAQRIIGTLRTLCETVSVPQKPIPPAIEPPPPKTYTFSRTYGVFDKFLGSGAGACAGAAPGNTQPTSSPPPASGSASSSGSPSGGTANARSCPTATGSDVAKFNSKRQCECTPASESAEKWCVESESAKAYRTVMDMAGPALMGLNAAARVCGGMNDVSKFVGAGLTAVNGVCIAKKLSCEKKCQEVSTQFSQAYRQEFFPRQQQSFNDEYATAREACVNAAEVATCQSNVMARVNAYRDAVAGANRIYETEGNPQRAGTVPYMIAKCEAKQRNIIGLATNIGAILLAAQNAKKCEKELQAPGTTQNGGLANVTGSDYCSNEATSNSQFCKCKGSPSTEGCAAVLAAGPSGENNIQDQRGVNLQSGRGPSAFAGAGGSDGSGSAGGYRGYNAGSDGAASTQTSFGAVTSSMGAGSGGSVGGFTGAGAPGATSGSAALDAKAKKEEDKAKWSFGGMASSLGASLGFGGGGGSRGGESATALQADQQAMIERKLASDRYAAEISPSTGADNFSKIKRSYVQKADTFMGP